MKVIARFYLDCGRMGDLSGLFVTTKEKLEASYGKEVYFGEVLGKHSDIGVDLNPKHITILTDDQEFIDKFEKIMGSGTVSGYNPLEIIDEYEEEQ